MLKILLGVFLLIAGPIWLCFYLRKKYPLRRWLGIILCLLFPLFGQVYLKDWAWYVIAVFAAGVLLYNLTVGGILLWICMGLISAGLMHYRFGKIAKT